MKEATMKRKMMITLFSTLLLLGTTITASAMTESHGGPRHFQRMADQLDLTKEQRQQFKKIHRKNRATLRNLRDAEQDNFEALHELNPDSPEFSKETARLAHALGAIIEQKILLHSRIRARVYALLTPEQRKKAKELRKHQMARQGRPNAQHHRFLH